MFVCLGSLILSFTCNFFAYLKFHSDWGRVIGKIKQNELYCRDTAPLTFNLKINVLDKRTTRRTIFTFILVQVIAWFVVIFGINATSDISKLLNVIPQAVRRVKFETILKYRTNGIYAKYLVQIMLLFVYTATRNRLVIFTCSFF